MITESQLKVKETYTVVDGRKATVTRIMNGRVNFDWTDGEDSGQGVVTLAVFLREANVSNASEPEPNQ